MQVNHDFDVTIHRIKSYDKGEIAVVLPVTAGLVPLDDTGEAPKGLQTEILSQSAIVTPQKIIHNWGPKNVTELTGPQVQQLADLNPEVVIIGTGERLVWPDRKILAPLINANIGYEIMDNAAACRTYNILSHEGRGVATALILETN